MKRLIATVALIVMYIVTNAQFINDGATITIQSGATLRIESDFQNNGNGTLTNNGTLEVSGNFTNAGTAILTPSVGLVKFIGTGNSNLDAGGDALNNVEMAKTTSTGTLTLVAPASINGNLSFTGTGNNRISIGSYDLTMTGSGSLVTATTDHPTNGWVVTDKTGTNKGKFIKNVASGSSTKILEIGDNINYSPVAMAINASSAGTVGARVLTTNMTAKYTEASDFINREWVVSTTNLTSNALTGTYVAGDITGTQSLIKGATYHTGDWRFDGSSGSGNTITASTTNSDVRFSGLNFFGKVNLKAFLQGAYGDFVNENSTGEMKLNLKTLNLIPLTSPYDGTTVTSIPADIVDWVRIDLRDASNSALVLGSASGFIKKDGSVVGTDGISHLKVKNGNPNSIVSIHHRNHLPVRTPSGIDVSNYSPSLYNFSSNLSMAYDSPSVSNDAMKLITGSGSNIGNDIWCLWAGNGSGNNRVRYSGSTEDMNYLLNTPTTNSPPDTGLGGNVSGNINNIYSNSDYNMDGRVRYSGSTHDVAFLLNVVLNGLTNGLITQSF